MVRACGAQVPDCLRARALGAHSLRRAGPAEPPGRGVSREVCETRAAQRVDERRQPVARDRRASESLTRGQRRCAHRTGAGCPRPTRLPAGGLSCAALREEARVPGDPRSATPAPAPPAQRKGLPTMPSEPLPTLPLSGSPKRRRRRTDPRRAPPAPPRRAGVERAAGRAAGLAEAGRGAVAEAGARRGPISSGGRAPGAGSGSAGGARARGRRGRRVGAGAGARAVLTDGLTDKRTEQQRRARISDLPGRSARPVVAAAITGSGPAAAAPALARARARAPWGHR